MNNTDTEVMELLRGYLYPNGAPVSIRTPISEVLPNTRLELLEQLTNEWRQAFGDLEAQAKIVTKFQTNLALVLDPWSLRKLRSSTPSSSALEKAIDSRLAEVLPPWASDNENVDDLIAVRDEFAELSESRDLIVERLRQIFQSKTDLDGLFEEAQNASYMADEECNDLVYAQLELLLKEKLKTPDQDWPKWRSYWEQVQELAEDEESELIDLLEAYIQDFTMAPARTMDKVLEVYCAASGRENSKDHDEQWQELFEDCQEWMEEQVRAVAAGVVEEDKIPGWFIQFIREPETQPEFLADEIRIVAKQIYDKLLP